MLKLQDILLDIANKLGLIDDYVVEAGTSGIWTYRKWASGNFDLWGYASYTSSTTAAVVNKIPFPFEVKEIKSAVASPNFNAWAVTKCYLNQEDKMSDVSSANMTYFTTDNYSRTYSFSMQIIGAWK